MEGTMEDWEEDSKRLFPAILELACYRGYDSIIGSYACMPQQLPVAPALVALATLESIVKSGQTERYGDAVALLEHLHDTFPEAVAEGEDSLSTEMEYTELLVDIKTKAVFSQLLGEDFTSDKTRKYAVLDKFFDPQLCKSHSPGKGPEPSSSREYDSTFHAFARSGLEELILSDQKRVEFQRRNLFYPPQALQLHRNLVTSLNRYLDKIRAQIPEPKILQWLKRASELETEGVALTADSQAHSSQADSEPGLDHNHDLSWVSPPISPLSSVSSLSQRRESPPLASPPHLPISSPSQMRESPPLESPLISPLSSVSSLSEMRDRPPLASPPHLPVSRPAQTRENPPLESPLTSPHLPFNSPPQRRENPPLESPLTSPRSPFNSPSQRRGNPPFLTSPRLSVGSPSHPRGSPPLESPLTSPRLSVGSPSQTRGNPPSPSSSASTHISVGSPSQTRGSAPSPSPSASTNISVGSPSWTRESPPWISPPTSPQLSVGSPSRRREGPPWISPPTSPYQAGEIDVMCTDEEDDSAVGTSDADSPIVKPAPTTKCFSIEVEKLQMPQLRKQQATPISIVDEAPFPFAAEETLSESDRILLELAASPVSSPFQAVASSPVSSPFQAVASSPVSSPFRAVASSPVSSPFQAVASSPVSSPFLAMVGNSVNSPFRSAVGSSDSIVHQTAESDTTEDEHHLVIAGLRDDAFEQPVSAPRRNSLPKPTDTRSPRNDALKARLREQKKLSSHSKKMRAKLELLVAGHEGTSLKRSKTGKLSVIPHTETRSTQNTSAYEASGTKRRILVNRKPRSLSAALKDRLRKRVAFRSPPTVAGAEKKERSSRSRMKRTRLELLVADHDVPVQGTGLRAGRLSETPGIQSTHSPSQNTSESEAAGSERRRVAFRSPTTVAAAEKKDLSIRIKRTRLEQLVADHDVPIQGTGLRTGRLSETPGIQSTHSTSQSTSESEAAGSKWQMSVNRKPRSSHKVFRSSDTVKGQLRKTAATTPPTIHAAEKKELSGHSRIKKTSRSRLELLVAGHDVPFQGLRFKKLRTGKLLERPRIQSSQSPSQSSSEPGGTGSGRRVAIKSPRKLDVSSSSGSEVMRNIQKRKRRRLDTASPPWPVVPGLSKSWLDTIQLSSCVSRPRNGTAADTSTPVIGQAAEEHDSVGFDAESEETSSGEYSPRPSPVRARMHTKLRAAMKTHGYLSKRNRPQRRKKEIICPRSPIARTVYTFRERHRKPIIERTDSSTSESDLDSEQEGYNDHERVLLQHQRQAAESQPQEINLMDDEVEATQAQSQYDYTAIQRAALDTSSIAGTVVSESGMSSCSPRKSPALRRLREIPLR